jgi:hypothetical protein
MIENTFPIGNRGKEGNLRHWLGYVGSQAEMLLFLPYTLDSVIKTLPVGNLLNSVSQGSP